MVWPFRRKATAVPAKKGASYLIALGAGRAGLTGAGYDLLASEGYAQCVIAFACINKIATAAASVEPTLYQKGKKVKKLDSHALLDLIENPNPMQSGKEFIAHLLSQHRLCGSAYVFGNGIDANQRIPKAPRELQLLDPGKVKVVSGDMGYFPKAYEYRPNPNTLITYPVNVITGRSAILQLKSFNPTNPWYGLSPLAPAALAVDIHTGGQQWNKRLIDNGARPSGALTVKATDGAPGNLTDEQYGRVKEMIDQQFSGASNAGRPMLLEGGLEWTEMSLNAKDMEFMEGKHSAARDIALSFGVPPMLLGIPGDNTYSNMAEAKTAFWSDTVLPLLGWMFDGFNRWLTPAYGDDLFLWYDEEMIPALEPLRKEKGDRINAAGYMTINEKRTAMGLDEIDGGDVLLVPSTNVPIDMAGNTQPPEKPNPGAPPKPDEEDQEKHRKWLESLGYTPERAERLTKLAYG